MSNTPSKWTPCREAELATAGDSLQPTWRQQLASRILDALPQHPDFRSGYTDELAAEIVTIVVEQVQSADDLFAEAYQKLCDTQRELERRTRLLAEATDKLDAMRVELVDAEAMAEQLGANYHQLARDFDERGVQISVLSIELERVRDQLHHLEIERSAARKKD